MNRHRHFRSVLAAFVLLASLLVMWTHTGAVAQNRAHTLVEDGEAMAVIVIADEPDVTQLIDRVRSEELVSPRGTVEAWAKALAFWLEKATGAEFPIVRASKAPDDKTLILLGTSTLSKKFGFDGLTMDLRPEEARVVGFERGVAIFGERIQANKRGGIWRGVRSLWAPRKMFDDDVYTDRGVGHAVSLFLEEVVGYRFYYPYVERFHKAAGAEFLTWIHVPKLKSLEAPRTLKIAQCPAFLYRDGLVPVNPIEEDLEHGVPVGWIACRWGLSQPLSVNHIYNVIPKDFPDRPDLFAKGPDGKPMYDRRQGCPKCFAAPEQVDIYMEHIRHHDRTGEKGYSARRGGRRLSEPHRVLVGPSDAPWIDHDPRAQKWYRPERGRVGSQSDLVFNFVAELARRVEKEWPGRRVVAMGQNNYAAAPTDRVPLPDNVDVLSAISVRASPMNVQKVYQEANDRFVDAWHEKLKKDRTRFALWDYPGRPQKWTTIPAWGPHTMRRFYRRNRDKVAGTFLNGGKGYPIGLPMRAIWMRLLWNPDLDVDAFYREFCRDMFGPASEEMFDVIMECVDRYETVQWAERVGASAIHSGAAHGKIFPRHVVTRIEGRFFKAWEKARAADDPAYAKRIEILYNEDGPLGMHAFFQASERYHSKHLVHVQGATETVFHEGFEDDLKTKDPDHIAVTREESFKGDGSLALKGSGKGLRRYFDIDLQPDTKYTFSAALKKTGKLSDKKGDVQVALLNKIGDKVIHLTHLHMHTKNDGRWHVDRKTFETGDTIGRVICYVSNNNAAGTVYLDEMTLVAPKPFEATRIEEGALTMDGRLDEALWEKAEEYSMLEGANPLNMKPPRMWWKTDFRVAFTDEALYIGVELSGEREMASGAREARDIYDDDHISLVIDVGAARDDAAAPPDVADMKAPYAEKILEEARGRLYLSVNPAGLTDPKWLQAATHRDKPSAMTAEIRVPFDKIGVDPEKRGSLSIDVRRWVGPRPSLADPPTRFGFSADKDGLRRLMLGEKK